MRRARRLVRGTGTLAAGPAGYLLLAVTACAGGDGRSAGSGGESTPPVTSTGPRTGETAPGGSGDAPAGAAVPVQIGATAAVQAAAVTDPAVVREIELGEPDAVLGEEFSNIYGARELSDGRLLVSDARENRLVVIDWTRDGVAQIGREGRGPGEYRSAGRLHAVRGDSTLFEDRRQGRWHLLDGDRITATVEYMQRNRRSIPNTVGADEHGRILVLHPYVFSRASDGYHPQFALENAESLLVLLEQRGTGARDTLLRLRGRSRGLNMVRKSPERGAPKIPWYVGNPLAANDQPLLFPDGWVALARLAPYRVDWRDPSGRWTRGAPLPTDTVRVDARQRRFAVDRRYHPEVEMQPDELPDWPAVVPPFLPDALLGAPDGRLLIRRTSHADQRGTVYDVVDRGGRLVGRITLPEKAEIIAVGRRHLYVAVETDWFLQRLERHPWPE